MKKSVIIIICAVMCLALAAGAAIAIKNGSRPVETPKDKDSGNSVAGVTLKSGSTELSGSEDVLINAPGKYTLSGKLGAAVYVDASGSVEIVLNGVSINCKEGPAINAAKGCELKITVADGSENSIISGTKQTIISSDKNPSLDSATGAAIYSKSNTTISGNGKLFVGGYINNGIACTKDLVIAGGNVEIESANNGLKGNDFLDFKGGNYQITAGNDGIKSETKLEFNGGNADIRMAVEGIEAPEITINDGSIRLVSSDDGINASSDTTKPVITINGGTVYVNAAGDGLDSNGDLIINGGLIVVDGPTSGRDTALDCGTESGGRLIVNGGTVLAMCNQGMVEGFSQDSAQCSFLVNLSTKQAEGSSVVIKDASGKELYSGTMAKSFNALVFSSPELEIGQTYTVEAGSEKQTIEQSSISAGSGSGSFGHGGMGGGAWGGQGGMKPGREDFGGQTPQGGFRHDQMPGNTDSNQKPPEGFNFKGGVNF